MSKLKQMPVRIVLTPLQEAYGDGVSAQMSRLPMSDNHYDPIKQPELHQSWCRGYYDSEDDE